MEKKILLIFMGLFLFSGILSAFYSPYPSILGLRSTFHYAVFLGISFLFLFLLAIAGENTGFFFLKVLAGLAVLLALVSFFEVANEGLSLFLSDTYRNGERLLIGGRARAGATLQHSNIFGCFMSLSILIIFYLKKETGLKAKLFYPAVTLLLAAMVLPGSRNAMIVLLVPCFCCY